MLVLKFAVDSIFSVVSHFDDISYQFSCAFWSFDIDRNRRPWVQTLILIGAFKNATGMVHSILCTESAHFDRVIFSDDNMTVKQQ